MSLDALEKRLNAFKKKPAVKKSSGGKKKKEEEKPAPVFEGFPEIEAETDDYADDHRWLKKILAIGSAISLIIIGLGLFFILSYSRTSRDVVLEISPIAEDVSRGAPFEIEINVTNNSGAPIKGAAITLTLPQGIIAPDSSRDRSVIKDDVGDVTSGNLVKKSYPLVAIDEVGSKKTITAVLSYSIPNGARFEDRQTQEMEIKNSAIEINMKRPDQILSGSTFSLKVDYENKSDFSFQNLTLEADYPSAFRFDSASVPPASLNNYWRLGSLSAKASGTLSISGHMNLSAGMSATVPVEISASFGGQDYAIGESFVNISPSASPLSLQVLIPLLAGIILMAFPRNKDREIKTFAILASFVVFLLSLVMFAQFDRSASGMQFVEGPYPWIPDIGISYHLGVDGLSMPLVFLTALLTFLSLIYSLIITERSKEYFILFLLLETGMMGTFVALDYVLFYVFWEISLVPMYFLIGIWGGPRREYAAIKFFLYTLVGSMAMLVAILAIYFNTGAKTFSILEIARLRPFHGQENMFWQSLCFFGFFLAFAIIILIHVGMFSLKHVAQVFDVVLQRRCIAACSCGHRRLQQVGQHHLTDDQQQNIQLQTARRIQRREQQSRA